MVVQTLSYLTRMNRRLSDLVNLWIDKTPTEKKNWGLFSCVYLRFRKLVFTIFDYWNI